MIDFLRARWKLHPEKIMTTVYTDTGVITKTYEEIRSIGEAFARGLEENKMCPLFKEDGVMMRTLGILIKNSWYGPPTIIAGAYYNCLLNFLYSVPQDHMLYNLNKGLFDTLLISPDELAYVLEQMEKKEVRVMKNFIFTEMPPADLTERVKKLGIKIFTFDDVVEKGRKSSFKFERGTKDQPFFVVSTSGSTGVPKGAVLTNCCVRHNAAFPFGPFAEIFGPDSVMLNNNTLGFGTVLGFNTLLLCRGGTFSYVDKKGANYFEQLKTADPTFVVIAPIVFNKLYQGITQVLASLPSPKKEMIQAALEGKIKHFKETRQYTHPEYDKVVSLFRKQFLGDRLKYMLNSGASISDEVLTFFRVFTGAKVINMYGSSEIGGFSTFCNDVEPAENIGTPFPGWEFKLVDVPEKNYTVNDVINGKHVPRGEVRIVKSTSVDVD